MGQTSYGVATPKEAIEQMARSMVLAMHTRGGVPERDRRVSEAYEKLTGAPFDSSLAPPLGESAPGFFLHGPPGYGKTFAVEEASRLAARVMGMNFVDLSKVSDDYQPGPEDYVLAWKFMGGEISAVSLDGLPSRQKDEFGEYVKNIADMIIHKTRRAGGVTLLFDDVSNMHPSLVGKLLNVLWGQRTGSGSISADRISIALTGNLGGGLDSAVGARSLGSAVASRCVNMEIVGDMKEWVDNHNKYMADLVQKMPGSVRFEYPDIVGMFVNHHGDDILQDSPSGSNRTFCNYRTLGILREVAWQEMHAFTRGDPRRLDDGDLPERLERMATGIVGPEAGSRFGPFVSAVLSGDFVLARNVLQAKDWGAVDKAIEDIRTSIGECISPDERLRAGRISMLLADHAATKVLSGFSGMKNGGKIDENDEKAIVDMLKIVGDTFMAYPDPELTIGALSHLYARIEPIIAISRLEDNSNRRKEVLRVLANGFRDFLSGMDEIPRHDALNALSGCNDHDLFSDVSDLDPESKGGAGQVL